MSRDVSGANGEEIYLINFLLLPCSQTILERQFCLWVVARLRTVTNEQLVFNSVVKITGKLECLDIDLQEDPEPAKLKYSLVSKGSPLYYYVVNVRLESSARGIGSDRGKSRCHGAGSWQE